MQILFLGIVIIALGIQALHLKNQSKAVGFKNFSEPYKNRLAKFPTGLITIVFVIGISVSILGITKYKTSKKSTEEIDFLHLKTQTDLNNYVTSRADAWCETWQQACNYKNETKRWEEQLYVDGMIDNFTMSVLPSVVQTNDLPNSYIEPAKEIFLNKMKACGWSTIRSTWPGQH